MTILLTRTVARLLLAPILIVAAGVLVKGYADVGDGFAAGVVAGLGVLVVFAVFGIREAHRVLPVRYASATALAGLLVALVVAFAPSLWGEPPFTHSPGPGDDVIHVGTIEILTAVAFDIGVFLLVLGAVVGAIDAAARARRRL